MKFYEKLTPTEKKEIVYQSVAFSEMLEGMDEQSKDLFKKSSDLRKKVISTLEQAEKK